MSQSPSSSLATITIDIQARNYAFDESADYQAFLDSHPHGSFFQSITWAKYQYEAFHRKSIFILIKDNEQIICSSLLILHRLPFGKSYIYSPRGPLFCHCEHNDDNLVDHSTAHSLLFGEIEKIAKQRNSIFFLCDPLITGVPNLQSAISNLQSSTSHQPKTTLTLDLQLDEAQLLSQMKEKGRYNIRLAGKKGVKVRPGTISELYPLFVETGKRDGFGIHPKKVYQDMVDTFGEKAVVLVADYENQIISGGICIYDQQLALYYYGASSNTHRNLMAPYLVQWEAIREGKKRGCTTYDFLGIADEGQVGHRLSGVTEFKMKFGGQVVKYIGAYRLVYDKFWTWLYDLRHREKPVAHDCQTE